MYRGKEIMWWWCIKKKATAILIINLYNILLLLLTAFFYCCKNSKKEKRFIEKVSLNFEENLILFICEISWVKYVEGFIFKKMAQPKGYLFLKRLVLMLWTQSHHKAVIYNKVTTKFSKHLLIEAVPFAMVQSWLWTTN